MLLPLAFAFHSNSVLQPLPPQSRRLQLILFDKDVFSSADAIGSAQLDLGDWCRKLFRAATVPGRGGRPGAAAEYFKPKSLEKDTQVASMGDVVEQIFSGKLPEMQADEPTADSTANQGEPHKFWLPFQTVGSNTAAGEVLISVEMVPAKDASGRLENAEGRDEPNRHPKLPPPTGRLAFTLNPFVMGWRLLGPTYCMRVLLAIGAMMCVLMLWSMLPVLLAEGLRDVLHGAFG